MTTGSSADERYGIDNRGVLINDSMRPEIGQNGAIKYSAAWKAVVEGGWKLTVASDEMYVFEKCR